MYSVFKYLRLVYIFRMEIRVVACERWSVPLHPSLPAPPHPTPWFATGIIQLTYEPTKKVFRQNLAVSFLFFCHSVILVHYYINSIFPIILQLSLFLFDSSMNCSGNIVGLFRQNYELARQVDLDLFLDLCWGVACKLHLIAGSCNNIINVKSPILQK